MGKSLSGWLVLALLMALGACTATSAPPAAGEVARAQAAASDVRIADSNGVWKGRITSLSGAIRNVTFVIRQKGHELRGAYRCTADKGANAYCRNLDETGNIDQGTLYDDKFLAIVTVYPDYSFCKYQGWLAGNSVNGSYSCYLGGAIADMGSFAARREPKTKLASQS